MEKLLKLLIVIVASLFACSCNEQKGEPDTTSYVTFLNNSSHEVSVTFEGIAQWCKIDDFTLLPNDKLTFYYEGIGLDIYKATVTYDSIVSIVHEKSDESLPEGFRNICYLDTQWWERADDNSIGYKYYYTYVFYDNDYEFAVNHEI